CVEASAGVTWDSRHFLLQAIKLICFQIVDELHFTTAKTRQLDVTVALNVEPHAVYVWQRFALRIAFPVIIVLAKEYVRARFVFRYIKGTENGHLFLWGIRRNDGDLIELAFKPGDGSGKRDNHNIARRSLDVGLSLPGVKGITRRRMCGRVKKLAH